MFTLGYSFKPWTEPRRSPTGRHPELRPRDRGRERHRQEDPLQPSRQAGVVVVAGRALDRRGRAHDGRGRDRDRGFTCNFLFMCSGYYNYEAGYTPEFAGRSRFRRPDRASAEMARRPRLCRQARRRDRLRRDRGDAGAGDGQDRRARHHAAALADLRGGAAGGGCAGEQAAAQSVRQARLSSDPLAQRAVRHVFLPALPAQAGAGQAVDPGRRQDGARAGLRHRHAFHAALQSLGPAAVPGARRRPVQGDPRQAAPRSSPARSTPSPRTASG